LAPISTKRAYTEVLFVFSSFFLVGVVAAALLLAGRTKDVHSDGSWAFYGAQTVDVIVSIALAVVLVMLLCERRGVTRADLGLTLPRGDDGRVASGQLTRTVAWGMFAIILGGIINALLQNGHHLPTTKSSAPELIFAVFDSANAGIVEELVVLAFVVVTLRQARRPLWEITLVALVLRGSYHIYYGAGVVGILVWAALYYWIYLRTRSLIPLMICHALWDMVQFLGQRWPAIAGVGVLVVLGLWLAAPITWLSERSDAKRRLAWQQWQGYHHWPAQGSGQPLYAPSVAPQPSQWLGAPQAASPAQAPPGWHPDPSGANRWRWWDGTRWTEHVSSHSTA
jgi:membrane protease YdiL (CAAX protease family)